MDRIGADRIQECAHERPGGRLALSTWDYHSQPAARPPQVPDHRPILTEAGFDVLAYEETDHWRDRQTRTAQGMLDALEELAEERGKNPGDLRADILEMTATFDCVIRRVLIVADRA